VLVGIRIAEVLDNITLFTLPGGTPFTGSLLVLFGVPCLILSLLMFIRFRKWWQRKEEEKKRTAYNLKRQNTDHI
jgi:hypothetical protein